ncbi:cyclin, partial [Cryptococcus neoformans A5-35-17]
MPAAPTVKIARTNSVYDRSSRASASPKSSRRSATQPKVKAQPAPQLRAAAQARKAQESLYFEEDYSDEIVEYMTSMDNCTLASADLMDMQPELQWFMRSYLIDFIIEVHQQFRLRPEVLYLAMNVVDRYISKRVVYKKHYQLVGCAALWIAAKFEDAKDKVPLVHELSEMCCKAYDESAFIQMEGHVLSTIGWVRGSEGGQHGEVPHPCYPGVNENLAARVATAIDKHFTQDLEKVSEIVIRKYSPTYYDRVSTVCREWYLSGRRYTYNPVVPSTPVSGMSTPGLAPSSSSWQRGSWAASPAGSCASSEAGDETP